MTYSESTSGLAILISDNSYSTINGTSGLINILFDSFTLTAVPVSTSSIRISFDAPARANSYAVYRNVGGSFIQVGTVTAPDTDFVDTGLTDGETYEYRVDVRDVSFAVIKQGQVSVVLNNCTTNVVLPQSITVPTTYTKAGSPYCFTGSAALTVDGVPLVIEPGVVLKFDTNSSISVINAGGALHAKGTATELITFTSSNPTATPDDWNGINYNGSITTGASDITVEEVGGKAVSETLNSPNDTTKSLLKFVLIEYGGRALITRTPLWVELSLFRANDSFTGHGGAIYGQLGTGEWMVVHNSSFQANEGQNGGSIYLLPQASGNAGQAVIRGNSFIDGNASDGGAIYLELPNTTVAENVFRDTAEDPCGDGVNDGDDCGAGEGGAIYLKRGVGVSDANNFILNNYFDSKGAYDNGGCIYIDQGNGMITISGNTFEGCEAEQSGGAIYHYNSDDVFITDNTFLDSKAYEALGGAVTLYGATTGDVNGATLTGNVFEQTFSGYGADDGGGIYLRNTESVVISGNTFRGLRARNYGGAIYSASISATNSPVINGNLFEDTYANDNGGGIYLGRGDIIGNAFLGSRARLAGGGVYLSNTIITVEYNSFIETTTSNGSSTGGAVHVQSGNNIQINYNDFFENWAEGASSRGADIYIDSGSPTIDHNSFNSSLVGTAPGVDNALATDSNATVTDNWWGIDLSGVAACGSAGTLCDPGAGITPLPNLTGNTTVTWPRRCNSGQEANADAVGAVASVIGVGNCP